MPKRRPDNYLRTRRMQTGLSVREFAKLTGYAKQTISKYELGQIPPSARLIVVCELLFGLRYQDLFPKYCEAVEDALGTSASALDRKLAGRKDARSRKVLALLSAMAKRNFPNEI
jgi:transcriptional regulator with XRE-family HTH domain